MPTTFSFPTQLCTALGVLFLAIGCQQSNKYQPPPPPPVTVAKPVQSTVTEFLEETGTTEAVEFVEVRARVKGFLKEIHFTDGQQVKAGDLLYTIEPDLYQAKLAQSEAALQTANAEMANAQARYDRVLKLRERNATTQEEVDQRKAELDVAKAAIEAANAAIREAKLNVEYTKVVAPIAGRVEKTRVDKGNLVGDGQATHLTTIVKYDPIYATFNISEAELLELIDQRGVTESNEDLEQDRENVKLYLKRANDEKYRFQGKFDYADLAVDQSTGTFLVRGIFPNPDLTLLPGLFVRVRIPRGKKENAVLVPEQCVLSDQFGRYVLVLNSQNEVERRDVVPGMKIENMLVLESGLAADEKIVIKGLQRARPGSKVTPSEGELDPLPRQEIAASTDKPIPNPPEPTDPTDPEPTPEASTEEPQPESAESNQDSPQPN